MAKFFAGLDLGQAQDYTALCIIERLEGERAIYHVRHLQRFKLGTAYPEIVKTVKNMLSSPPLKENTTLVVDATGVGAPVVDLLRQGQIYPVAVTITGGDSVSHEGDNYRVPKRDLVSTLTVLFQTGQLKVAEALPDAHLLVSELLNFKVKISAGGHDSYEAWREGVHDDLVLCVALACWQGEYSGKEEAWTKALLSIQLDTLDIPNGGRTSRWNNW